MKDNRFDPKISTPEAIGTLSSTTCLRYDVLPLAIVNEVLVVGMTSDDSEEAISQCRSESNRKVHVHVMPLKQIVERLKAIYPRKQEWAISTQADTIQARSEKIANDMLESAVKQHVSDIHIEWRVDHGQITFRRYGDLHEYKRVHRDEMQPLISHLKIRAAMNTTDKRTPHDGRHTIEIDGRKFDARLASMPARDDQGRDVEDLYLRILPFHHLVQDFNAIGMSPQLQRVYQAILTRKDGMVLITGAIGSGKTTTGYSSLRHLLEPLPGHRRRRSICSIEDPIEVRIPRIAQRQVNEVAGFTFPVALRAFMRSDKNIIYIGEMRDDVTAKTAINAALTGQLVIATLHANDAIRSIERLEELELNPKSIASGLRAVLSQHLVRKLCAECKKPSVDDSGRVVVPEPMLAIGVTKGDFYAPTVTHDVDGNPLVPGTRKCHMCAGTGFNGRIGVFELLVLDDDVRQAIRDQKSVVEIKRQAIRSTGFKPLIHDAIAKACAGITTAEAIIEEGLEWPFGPIANEGGALDE